MADRRTVTKRDGQVKLIKDMMVKGRDILEDESRSKNPQRELVALIKNIKSKKMSIDELSENILNTVEEEKMEDEMRQSTELDLMIDTDLEFLESYLTELSLNRDRSNSDRIRDMNNGRGFESSQASYSNHSRQSERIEEGQIN